MYHRFDENKYPSTNIRIEDFKRHLNLVKNENIEFINPNNFKEELKKKDKRKILLTIDDGFLSFYENAWPLLKKDKIPFILFVSTREVGKKGYMSWKQIKEIEKENFVTIGNHSHSHDYLIDFEKSQINEDIKISRQLFKKELEKNLDFFSYPFGEYSLMLKEIAKKNFTFAFGQHSGVIDETKDMYELPRFPINEKYGEIKRFKNIINTLPLQVKKIYPEEKYINDSNNPPKVKVEFYEGIKDLKNINCFSNENNKWRNSNIKFLDNNILEIILSEKFTTERGRINCSLRNQNGMYHWLGMQFVIAEL